jgi:hypothetical protein
LKRVLVATGARRVLPFAAFALINPQVTEVEEVVLIGEFSVFAFPFVGAF